MVYSTTDSSSSAPLLPSLDTPKLSSPLKTFANVLISIVGSGVLGLPFTFSRTGYLAGIILLILVALLTLHCMLLLLQSRRKLDENSKLNNNSSNKLNSFGDVAFAVSGPLGRHSVDSMILLSQSGFCAGYLIFIANTLPHVAPILSKITSVAIVLPFQLALNSIKTLTVLAPLSIFADAIDLVAKTAVMWQDVSVWLQNRPAVMAVGEPSALLYGLGVAVYAFEGIGMVIPLEAEAADKGKFGLALGMSMGFIASLYGLFGVLGYLAFGADTADIITTNFGGGLLTKCVEIGLVVNLFFTFPVMMNPVYEVLERWFVGKRYCWPLRWVVVVVVCLVATLVPNFTDFLALVGSSVCVVLGFVMPAVFHLKVFGSDLGWFGIAADIAVVVLGVFVAVMGTWSSLMAIINTAQV